MLFLRVIVCSLLLQYYSNGAQCADVYHWVDEKGRVHYGDSYTPGAEVIELEARATNAKELEIHQQRQRLLQKTLDQQSETRRQQESHSRRIAERRDRQRAKITAICNQVRARLESVRAQWEITRRKGYKTSDKQSYLQKHNRLAKQWVDLCG